MAFDHDLVVIGEGHDCHTLVLVHARVGLGGLALVRGKHKPLGVDPLGPLNIAVDLLMGEAHT